MYLVNQDVSECVFGSKPGRLRNLVFVCETSLKTEFSTAPHLCPVPCSCFSPLSLAGDLSPNCPSLPLLIKIQIAKIIASNLQEQFLPLLRTRAVFNQLIIP